MRRCSIIVMLAILLGTIGGQGKIASATEINENMELQKDKWCEIRTVLQPDSSRVNLTGNVVMEQTEVCLPDRQRDATHTERTLSATHEILANGEVVAWVDVVCTVWDYPDGKVHLYRRTMSLTVTSGFESSYLTYGSIFNTDGSYSGTTGDRVCVTDGTHTAHFGLYFYVTRETYNFSSARVAP